MGKYKIVSTIEARMTSSRLPGKVLLEANGIPLLQILIERLKKAKYIDEIILATTINQTDDPIVDLCKKINIKCYRGSELNVLDRVCGAAKYGNADIIVEVTGDDTLNDPALIDGAITTFLDKYPTHRYVGNLESVPWGFDVKIFTAKDLYEINENNPDEMDKEHVSYSFYKEKNKEKYNPYFIKYEGEICRPELRVSLDYEEDYMLIKKTYEYLYPKNHDFGILDVIHWLDANPEIRDSVINIRKKMGTY